MSCEETHTIMERLKLLLQVGLGVQLERQKLPGC